MIKARDPEMEAENEMKNDDEAAADSPTSVLQDDEEDCKEEEVGFGSTDDAILVSQDVDDGNASHILRVKDETEEEKLQGAQVKQEVSEGGTLKEEIPVTVVNKSYQFMRLDELVTKSELYSEFLLEGMEHITHSGAQKQKEETVSVTRGRRAKRKADDQYNGMKAKKAVAAMLSRSKEGPRPEDANLTEDERVEKEQHDLVPLLTGGKLKPYQLKGVKWLISLWQNGLNGILADQMGLGKTIQTIGLLAHLKGRGLDGPYLVIAPLSTLSNWLNEISRFTPSMTAIVYHGDLKERQEIRKMHMPEKIGPNFPIIIASYHVVMNDVKFLKHYSWKYVVVDEGHRLKNANCKLLQDLKQIPMENKLILTGTPLHNNLSELWSLLNFILPDIFPSHGEFLSWFDFSSKCDTEGHQEEEEEKKRVQVVSKLHLVLRPFLLRRLKTEVEKTLPVKKEIILYASMTEYQRNIQDHLVNKTLVYYMRVERDRRCGIRGKLNNLIIQLRKNCNHPDLLESAFDGSTLYPPIEELVDQCGKFRLLDTLLSRLFAKKHKVLIFSQWTKILDILDYYLEEKGFETCRIDGRVKLDERERQIQEFNDLNSEYRVFLISTRAGGLGINLTAADTCILYDSDWNPQMDLQAMDRCHRIGQTRPVHVYRLSTAQSVEGRMLKRAFSKLKLEQVVIGKGQFQQERTKPNSSALEEEEDLLALLRDDEDSEEKMIQTDISDNDLERIIDRSDMITNPMGDDDQKIEAVFEALPIKGPGWEVVIPHNTGGVLSALTS